MAINDWDGNGRTDDLYDEMVENDLYKKNLKRHEEEMSTYNYNNTNSGNSNAWGIVFIVGIIMAVIGFISNLD